MSKAGHTVRDFCTVMEGIAPTDLAQPWDRVGLVAGDLNEGVRRVLLCIDLTPEVVDEAISKKNDLVLAYHPPIFKPIASLRVPSRDTDESVFRCIRGRIAIYSPHTALDAVDGGTNDVLASLCDIKETQPFEHVDEPGLAECKLVVFVSADDLEKVSKAMFDAGAGHIGNYSHCSYRTEGEGTFLGGDDTNPTLGRRGRFETVDEFRLETIVPGKLLPAVVSAMIRAHSYDEPAFDIYPLKRKPIRGIGRFGPLPRPTTLRSLARKLKRATGAPGVQIVGPPDRKIDRAVMLVGAAGSMPLRVGLTSTDVVITGEIRHHDALTIRRYDATAIALGHWSSERPALAVLARRLVEGLPSLTTMLSVADVEPFQPV